VIAWLYLLCSLLILAARSLSLPDSIIFMGVAINIVDLSASLATIATAWATVSLSFYLLIISILEHLHSIGDITEATNP